jgi:hypothetical protein
MSEVCEAPPLEAGIAIRLSLAAIPKQPENILHERVEVRSTYLRQKREPGT